MEAGLATERAVLDHDLSLIVSRTPRGPWHTLARAIHHMFFHQPEIANRGPLWTGLWSLQHCATLGPHLRPCSLKEGRRILLDLSTWAIAGVSMFWQHFKGHVADREPLPPNQHR